MYNNQQYNLFIRLLEKETDCQVTFVCEEGLK